MKNERERERERKKEREREIIRLSNMRKEIVHNELYGASVTIDSKSVLLIYEIIVCY